MLREAAVLVVIDLAIGFGGFMALAKAAASLLFDISPRDPLHLGSAAIALAAAPSEACCPRGTPHGWTR